MADAKGDKKPRRTNISEPQAVLFEMLDNLVAEGRGLASIKIDNEDRKFMKKFTKLLKQVEVQTEATKDIESMKTIRLNVDRAEELLADCVEWANECGLEQIAGLLKVKPFRSIVEKIDATPEQRCKHTCRGIVRNAIFDIFHQCLNYPKNKAHSDDDFATFMRIYRPNGKVSKLLPFTPALPATCHEIYNLYVAHEGEYNVAAQCWDISGSMLSSEIMTEKLPKVLFGLNEALPDTAPEFVLAKSKITVALMSKQSAEEMIATTFKLLLHMGGLTVVSKTNKKTGKDETVYEVGQHLEHVKGQPKNPMFSLFRAAENYCLADRTPTGGIALPAAGSGSFSTHNRYNSKSGVVECKKLEFNSIARFFTLSAYIPETKVEDEETKKIKPVLCPNFSDIAAACMKFKEANANGSQKSPPKAGSSRAVDLVRDNLAGNVELLERVIEVAKKRTQLDTFYFVIATKCAKADDRQNWLKATPEK